MDTIAKSDLHLSILRLFVARAESYREWMEIPFKIGDMAYATDGHAMVFFVNCPESNLPELEEKKASDVLAAVPKERNKDLIVPIAEIISAMQKAPLMEGYDEKSTKVTCDACDGYGEVEFEFDHNGKTYYSESDCPLCDGHGSMDGIERIPNGKQIPNPEYNYSIIGAAFSTVQLNRVLKVAELVKVDSIKLTYQASAIGNHIFEIGSVEILQMPINIDNVAPETIIQIA